MNLKMTYQTLGTPSNCETDLLKPIRKMFKVQNLI